MADIPDIYADGVGVSIGPFGVTITLQRSQPGGEVGVITPDEVVGRVRLSTALARALARSLTDALAQSQEPPNVKH